MKSSDLWSALREEARAALKTRAYGAESAVEAGQLLAAARDERWIPGVEIFPRTIYPQRHRGSFGEFARRDEGALKKIGFWPAQWATARMFAQTAKGFHIHPPNVPNEFKPADWFRKLFVEEPENFSLRRYPDEQWDVMFFVQGVAEMILHEARAGMPARTMRLLIDGDNHRSANNVGVIIPPGVAHAIRVEGSEDLIMVYGTSTSFRPEFEGRIASEVETATLPESWQRYLHA
ncbi:MAG: hypothetical protein ACR2HH_02445 [Chthoniobacterales bacterium]